MKIKLLKPVPVYGGTSMVAVQPGTYVLEITAGRDDVVTLRDPNGNRSRDYVAVLQSDLIEGDTYEKCWAPNFDAPQVLCARRDLEFSPKHGSWRLTVEAGARFIFLPTVDKLRVFSGHLTTWEDFQVLRESVHRLDGDDVEPTNL